MPFLGTALFPRLLSNTCAIRSHCRRHLRQRPTHLYIFLNASSWQVAGDLVRNNAVREVVDRPFVYVPCTARSSWAGGLSDFYGTHVDRSPMDG